jgi:hypothetical protein
VKIAARELPWLNRMEETVAGLPSTENEFIGRMMPLLDTSKFVARDYGL